MPRIKSLTYKVIPDETVDYDNTPEISEETDDFTVKVNYEKARFQLKDLFTSVQDAKAVADDFLDRWEVLIGLEYAPGDLKFKYKNAEYENIRKDGKNDKFLSVHSAEIVVVSDNVKLHVSRNQLPNRPYRFKLSPDVITMYERYKLYRNGKESLPSMAYMCLTVLEASARTYSEYNQNNNRRGKASHRYNIEYDVLDELGKLTAKGDELEARKVPKNGVLNPLTQEERDWIIRTVKILIRRAGEWAYDPTGQHSLITMEQT